MTGLANDRNENGALTIIHSMADVTSLNLIQSFSASIVLVFVATLDITDIA